MGPTAGGSGVRGGPAGFPEVLRALSPPPSNCPEGGGAEAHAQRLRSQGATEKPRKRPAGVPVSSGSGHGAAHGSVPGGSRVAAKPRKQGQTREEAARGPGRLGPGEAAPRSELWPPSGRTADTQKKGRFWGFRLQLLRQQEEQRGRPDVPSGAGAD